MKVLEDKGGDLADNKDIQSFMHKVEEKGQTLLPVIVWTKSMNTGIKNIDEQHKRLHSVISDLAKTLNQGKWSEVHDALFEELTEYFTMHFAVEEGLMLATFYPDYEHHRDMHNAFIRKVRDLRRMDIQGGRNVGRDALIFLSGWFVNHVLNVDKKMGKYILEKSKRL